MTKCYNCVSCNYTTKDASNLIRHNKTKKHLNNINQKIEENHLNIQSNIAHSDTTVTTHKIYNKLNQKKTYLCKYCKSSFSRADSLTRHKRTCNDKYDEVYELKQKLNACEHYKEEAKYYKQLLMEAGGLVKKSVSALTYSITNYDDAPPIKTIKVTNVDEFNESDIKIAEDIISACKHKTLNKYLGEIIVKEYKKKMPIDQSIWNTDDTRLTYIIKELIQNNSSNWIVDKKGIKTTKYLIDPLLKHVKSLIITYQENMDIGETVFEMEVHMENSKIIQNLISDIDDGITSKDILKYISVHLRQT